MDENEDSGWAAIMDLPECTSGHSSDQSAFWHPKKLLQLIKCAVDLWGKIRQFFSLVKRMLCQMPGLTFYFVFVLNLYTESSDTFWSLTLNTK